ncbi:hypothetical protein [Lacrimispora sp.]|uniref:hypothetical protein n=1 Tax=Lacrimispora sp. TaxID=2719234 RepID=UPI0028B1036F|nr:hypothetical protein [Lacrimispora sp.]
MAITEYGTIGIRPMGTYDPDTKYGLLNLVEFDGSSYVAHTDPPLGSLPTNTAYWQVSAQGTGKATASSVGTVKPDGATTEVNSDGSMSVKTALQDALGLVKGSNGIKVGADGSIDVNTLFTQATEMANIIAGEAIATALGKISKSIAVTMGLDQNALLKNMLTNIDANDSTKINTAAYVHKLTERIGMGDELAAGANLTAGLNALNSNLTGLQSNLTSLTNNQGNGRYSADLMATQTTCALLYWNGNTANTPFKAGITSGAEGMALVTGAFGQFQTVLAIPKGGTTIYVHATVSGVPTGWKALPIT